MRRKRKAKRKKQGARYCHCHKSKVEEKSKETEKGKAGELPASPSTDTLVTALSSSSLPMTLIASVT